MGAIQAQDFAMAKWAIGVRLQGVLEKDVDHAIDRGDILRTHLIRPTWHFVAAEDINWLLDLTAPQIKAAQKARDRQLELTEVLYTKSNNVIEKALSTGRHLTRKELNAELEKANIATDQNRASHLLARAELEKIICSGISRNGKTTYALLSDRVKQARKLNHEEALRELAGRYFASRCPATMKDFIWWSGLPAAYARQALEQVKASFQSEQVGEQMFWLPVDYSSSKRKSTTLQLLPPYDELLISYINRNASVPKDLEQHMKSVSDRGVFRPIVVLNGQVIGVWKRAINKANIDIDVQFFIESDKSIRKLIESASRLYGIYMQKPINLHMS